MTDSIEGRMRRLRNLPSFKNKTDEEVLEYINTHPQKPRKPRTKKIKLPTTPIISTDYDSRYNAKLNQLKDEYGVDMNEANDAENVRILVRLSIQLEDIDKQITKHSERGYVDTKSLKELGEFQKSLVNGISDVQDKLGITRKVRKEKQVDDIPQYLKLIRQKANGYWNRTTTGIICEKCQIELARYWLNFPDLATKAVFELECWKCGEKTVYVK